MSGRALASAILLFAGLALGAAPPGGTLDDPTLGARHSIHIYDERDGAVSYPIEAITQDARGYLWFGTQDGIQRYNGHEWTRIPLPDSGRSAWICSVLASRDGSMWFGTNGNGLHHLKDGVWTSYTQRTGFPVPWVPALAETLDARGRPVLWIGTGKEGLWKLEGARLVRMPDPESGPLVNVRALLAARDGSLWAGTGIGVHHFAGGAWTESRMASRGQPPLQVNCLAESMDESGPVLWAGTDQGLAQFRRGTWSTYHKAQGLPSHFVTTLAVQREPDGSTAIWAGTDRGLAILRNGSFTRLDRSTGLPSDSIRSLLVLEASGSPPLVWVGTFAGLARLIPGKWISLGTASGHPVPGVFSIREDADHSFWFATTGSGLLHFRKGTWSRVDTVEGRPLNAVFTLCPGPEVKYAGTRDLGVLVREGDRWRLWQHNARLPQPSVYAMLETRDASGAPVLWVGTKGGLLRSGPEGTRVFAKGSGLEHDHVIALAETRDVQGQPVLWVGTRGGGVSRYRGGSWETFGEAQGLPEGRITSLTVVKDPGGKSFIWAGTHSNGVAWFDPDHPERPWTLLSAADSARLPSRNVESVQADAKGRIYLFTLGGVTRLTPKGDGNYVLYNFTTGDGLPSNTCTMESSMVDSTGRLWTGTVSGVALHEPASEVEDTHAKPLYFGTCLELGMGGRLRDGAVLPHDLNHLRFEFSLLSFYREADSRYRVQLEGLDAAPGPWKAEPWQEYAALRDGNYTFKVWALDHAGNLSGPLAMSFRIRPAPWRHPVAIICYALLFLGAGWGLSRLRIALLRTRNLVLQSRVQEATAALLAREEQVELQARDLSEANAELRLINEQKNRFLGIAAHDLRNPLSGIVLTAELILEESEERVNRQDLERIIEQAQSMADLIGRFLDVTAIESGRLTVEMEPTELGTLAAFHASGFLDRAQAKAIELRAEIPGPGPMVLCDPRMMGQVLDNLLSNAVKFSPRDRTVRILVAEEGGRGRVSIVDQGPGLTADDHARLFGWFTKLSATPTAGEPSMGMGLSIVKNMVEAMGGTIRVDSTPGQGATFTVELPVTELT